MTIVESALPIYKVLIEGNLDDNVDHPAVVNFPEKDFKLLEPEDETGQTFGELNKPQLDALKHVFYNKVTII